MDNLPDHNALLELAGPIRRFQRLSVYIMLIVVSLFGAATAIGFVRQQQQINQIHTLAHQIQNERLRSCLMANQRHDNTVHVIKELLTQKHETLTAEQQKELNLELGALVPLYNCKSHVEG